MITKTVRKSVILSVLALTVAFTALTGCGKKNKGTVNVYNWGEYIDESIFEDFEKETGIEVVYQTFETNEDLYSKLKLGGSNYDVIIPSDYMVERMIEEDMLEKLDFANIPNAKKVSLRPEVLTYDKTGEYSVGYMWGTVGIIYNPTMIDTVPDSWAVLWDETYKDAGILQFDNSRDALGTALKLLGYSLNTENESELREAAAKLKEQQPIILENVMDRVYDLMEGGSAALAPYYAGDYIAMLENNEDLRFVIPKEGSNVFSDAMCIPKGAKNKKNAEIFINYMTGTEIAERNQDVTGYVSANAEAAQSLKDVYADDEYMLNILFPPDDVLAKCEAFLNLSVETRTLYDTLWTELKS